MKLSLALNVFGAAALGILCSPAPMAFAGDSKTQTPYYEKDAWYDVSEWLDGNDYNPTDEAIGRWDDETHHADASGSGSDSDATSGYGQDQTSKADDWFYDNSDNRQVSHYSDHNGKDVYAYRWDYFDYDLDGYYDAMTSFYDSDSDGSYDEFNYYAFSDTATAGDQQGKKTPQATTEQDSSKNTKLAGTLKAIKKVNVRGGSQRWVAQVATDDGQARTVDFGPFDELKGKLTEGQKVTVHGPLAKAGKHQVVVAQRAAFGDQEEQQINRSGRKLSGTITKMHRAKVRGDEHQMALLKLESGKQALVDLGNAESLGVDLSENDKIDVRGVPVKVKDRLVFIANSVTKSGEKTTIDRVAAKDRTPASS